jgi:hypothetical protein
MLLSLGQPPLPSQDRFGLRATGLLLARRVFYGTREIWSGAMESPIPEPNEVKRANEVAAETTDVIRMMAQHLAAQRELGARRNRIGHARILGGGSKHAGAPGWPQFRAGGATASARRGPSQRADLRASRRGGFCARIAADHLGPGTRKSYRVDRCASVVVPAEQATMVDLIYWQAAGMRWRSLGVFEQLPLSLSSVKA